MKYHRYALALLVSTGTLVGAAHAAGAVEYPDGGTPPSTLPTGTPESAPPLPPADHAPGLPFTGADVLALTAVGAGCVVAGAVLVRKSRREAQPRV